jgi:hypothetical protein
MTQKIFDTDNKEDMDLLWSILPESIVQIKDGTTDEGGILNLFYSPDYCKGGCGFININWHDKTEITRPVNYEDMIGYVCKFSSCPIRIGGCFIGVLDAIDKDSPSKFHMEGGGWFEYCEPAKKSELKFYGEDK